MTEKDKEWYLSILQPFVPHYEILLFYGFDYQFKESQVMVKHKACLFPYKKLVLIYSWDKEEMFRIFISKNEIKYYKLRGVEWKGFRINEPIKDYLSVFTGNRDEQAEDVLFIHN